MYQLQKTRFESFIIHGLLVLGCAVFALPFVWMVSTSFKVPRELTSVDLPILPSEPRPQSVSPFIDPTVFPEAKRPDDLPPAVWDAALPEIEQLLDQIVANWKPVAPGPDDNPPPALANQTGYREEMIQGIIDRLRKRISDQTRSCSINVEKQRRHDQDPSAAIPPDAVLVDELNPQSIGVGVQALLEETSQLVDETMLEQVFDQCYRRFLLGEVRIRTKTFEDYSLFPTGKWHVTEGSAQLSERIDGTNPGQEVTYKFTPEQHRIVYSFAPPSVPVDLDSIGQLFIRFRMDESWMGLNFEVTRGGILYQASGTGAMFDRVWTQQELRWPETPVDPTARKSFLMLHPVGPAPEGWGPLDVRITTTKASYLGAWYSKITRNYLQTFREVPYARYMMTSFSLVILNILLAIFSCTLVGYAFARLQWPGRDLCFGILLATMMIPAQVTMIPGFLVIKYLGWFNTLKPLWVPALFGAPFFIFLLRQFLKNIPIDLEEAARIDGCGFLRIYWHVCLPLIKPTIATIAIFTFMASWNNFMGPLIFVNDERLFPLALGLYKFHLRMGTDMSLMMAGSFVMTLPIIFLFFFAQRYFIQGISLTGTKG